MLRVIEECQFSQRHKEKNEAVFHMLSNSAAGRHALSVFSNKGIEGDGHVAW